MAGTAEGWTTTLWTERLARQERSQFSIVEFCRREGISPASFYGWRKRLRPDPRVPRRPLFVPVELPASVEASSGGVQIELPGGALVTLPVEASAELVTTAIRAAMVRLTSEERPSC